MTDITIYHETAQRRFVTQVDGHAAELTYAVRGDHRMVIEHTGVPAQIGGRGIAAELVRAALDYARAQGWKVIPACSYSAAYLQKHPEYADLVG